MLGLLRKPRILAIFLEIRDTNQVAPFHAEMMMHGGQPVAVAGLLDLEAGARPRLVGRAQTIDIDPDSRADLAGPPPPMSQKDRHHSVGLAGRDPDRQPCRPALILQHDHVFVFQTEPLRKRRADERRVVPRQFGQGLGQFLQPAVIGEPAVPDCRVRTEEDFEALAPSGCRQRRECNFFDLGCDVFGLTSG